MILPFTIVIDTREQVPYTFVSIPHCGTYLPFLTAATTLATGDYSVLGYTDPEEGPAITIERKSLSDAFGSFGAGRDRFEREFMRMQQYDYAAIVIEAEWSDIMLRPPPRSKLPPRVVMRSAIAWCQRYGVQVWCVPGREVAEQLVFRMLERWVMDHEGMGRRSTERRKENDDQIN